LFSSHREVSPLQGMVISQAPCFEMQVVTQSKLYIVVWSITREKYQLPNHKSLQKQRAVSG